MPGLPPAFHRAKALLAMAIAGVAVGGFCVIDLSTGRYTSGLLRALGAGVLLGFLGNLTAVRAAGFALHAGRRGLARSLYTFLGFALMAVAVALAVATPVGPALTGLPPEAHADIVGPVGVRVAVGYLGASFLIEASRAWRRGKKKPGG
jgi:hypothetical protein